MKSVLHVLAFLLLVLSFALPTFSQVPTTIYYDKNWKRVKSQKEAEYYRVVTLTQDGKPTGTAADYYISGEKQWECKLLSMDMEDANINAPDGTCTWYRKDGTVSQSSVFVNGVQEGPQKEFLANGRVSSISTYKNGLLDGTATYFYQSGKPYRIFKAKAGIVEPWFTECDEYGECEQVFQDLFGDSDNPNGWRLGNARITEGRGLVVQIPPNSTEAQLVSLEMDPTTDFIAEATLQQTKGNGDNANGIVFGMRDWNNYFYFYVSSTGYYMIGNVVKGLKLPIKGWTESSAIRKGFQKNVLRIHRIGDKIIYSINGNIVENTSSYRLLGTYFGLYTSGETSSKEVIFTDFSLRRDASVPSKGPADDFDSSGTGFFLDPRGYIATNHHVVAGGRTYQVDVLQGGKRESFNAKLIVEDKQNDLAILKISDPNFRSAGMLPYTIRQEALDVGASIFALGYPETDILGSELKYTDGKVSSKTGFKGDITTYQITVPVQPGNSGSPLFDSDGNIVGVVNAKITSLENVSFAIKTNYLFALMDSAPEKITAQGQNSIAALKDTEKIKRLSSFVVLIKTKQ